MFAGVFAVVEVKFSVLNTSLLKTYYGFVFLFSFFLFSNSDMFARTLKTDRKKYKVL